MQTSKTITILSTRPLEQALIDSAHAVNIILDTLPFIETTAIVDDETNENINRLTHQQIVAVFTSMNAVEAVAAYTKDNRPDWKIFCIGHATQKLVKENFGEDGVQGTADSAIALAHTIIAHGDISSVVFFCGDNRRDELPGKLIRHGITVNELPVYKTHAVAHKVNKRYDGIAFFSPSAVHSFFSNNTIPGETILFAIGNTTADTLKTYSANKVIVGESPGKGSLIRKALDYFQANPIGR